MGLKIHISLVTSFILTTYHMPTAHVHTFTAELLNSPLIKRSDMMQIKQCTLCLNFPPLTDFQTCSTAEKHMKVATKPIFHYPSHVKHIATWEIQNQIFADV